MADVQMGLRMPEASALNDVEEELIDYDDDTIDQTDATLVEAQPDTSPGTTMQANSAPTRCDFEAGEVVARKSSITEAELVSSEGHEIGDSAMSPNIPPEEVANSERVQSIKRLEPGTTNSASVGGHAPHLQGNSDIEGLSQDNVLDRGRLNNSAREISEPAEKYNGSNQLALESTGDHSALESPEPPYSTDHMAFGETDADEITWEEPLVTTEAEQIEDPGDSYELLLAEETSLDVSGGQVINPPDEGDAMVGLAKTEDIDFGQETMTSPSDQRSGAGQAEDASTMQQESAGASLEPFPSITVQYKGDEFPLLSSTSEGFFSDVSVLGETLDSLLAGFRVELANELAADEELVYQVDELGLEYAESSTRDILCNVTLRQILEIFDLLVKNQDPESSRVLYTYLFAKPSTSKRYESLLESATAGVGLNEVCHLFESPMPQTTTAKSYLSINDELDEMLENYESGSDENDGGEFEKAEQVKPQEETSRQPHETEESVAHHEGAVPEGSESALHSDYSIAGTTNTIGQHDNIPDEALQKDAHLSEPESQLIGSAGHHEDIDDHIEDSDAAIEVYDTGLSNDKAQADEVVDLYADDVEFIGDLNTEDELDEIDWREDALEGAINADISANTTKRSRSDEGLDAEDEKDAKRLRS